MGLCQQGLSTVWGIFQSRVQEGSIQIEHNKFIELRIKKLVFAEAETARNSMAGQQRGGSCRERDRETRDLQKVPEICIWVQTGIRVEWNPIRLKERERGKKMKLRSNKPKPSYNTHKAGNSLCFFQPEWRDTVTYTALGSILRHDCLRTQMK